MNAVALAKVREDKEREASQGFDGTWVAHPDLVPVARGVLRRASSATGRTRSSGSATTCEIGAGDLLDVAATPGEITEDGLRNNVSVGIQYLAAWLRGSGAVAINNLMEDAATAEISRSQIWQWLRHGRVDATRTCAGSPTRRSRSSARTTTRHERSSSGSPREPDYVEFLTLPAYDRLVAVEHV